MHGDVSANHRVVTREILAPIPNAVMDRRRVKRFGRLDAGWRGPGR